MSISSLSHFVSVVNCTCLVLAVSGKFFTDCNSFLAFCITAFNSLIFSFLDMSKVAADGFDGLELELLGLW